jgi:RES domain-containing protein
MSSDELAIEDLGAAVDWHNYESDLRANRKPESDSQYFTGLIEGCLKSRCELPVQSNVFRSRIMPPERQTDTEPFALEHMGAPPARLAPSGRLNREAVPVFYGALEEATAIAESRPWIMCRLTVAQFQTVVPIEVLDLTGSRANLQLTASVQFAAYMMSRPVHRDDKSAYLGTQHLAQELQSRGVKGVLYNSLLNPRGTNFALFTEEGLTGVSVVLHEVKTVAYTTSRLV